MRILIDSDMPDHVKTQRLARALNIDVAYAAGILTCLWSWTSKFRRDGNLTGMTAEEIACASKYKGNPQRLVDVLRTCELLDDKTGDSKSLQVHDWKDHCGKLMQRMAIDAERKRAERVHRTSDGRPQDKTSIGRPQDIVRRPRKKSQPLPLPLPQPLPLPLPLPLPYEKPPDETDKQDGNGTLPSAAADQQPGNPDPLDRVHLSKSKDLLESIGLSREISMNLAGEYPLFRIAEIVYASKGKRSRGGWVRSALDKGFAAPPLTPAARDSLIAEVATPNTDPEPVSVRCRLRPGESTDDYLARAQRELGLSASSTPPGAPPCQTPSASDATTPAGPSSS